MRKLDHGLVEYNSDRNMIKCVNNRCDVNYIKKFRNSYILRALPGLKYQASVTNVKHLLKSEKSIVITLPGCGKLLRF